MEERKIDVQGLIRAAIDGDEAGVRQALERGADPNARGPDGWMAGHHAAEIGHDGVLRILIEAGWNPDAEESAGNWAATDLAAARGGASSLAELLRGGADPNRADANGWTAGHVAAVNGSDDCLEALLMAGWDCGSRDREGRMAEDLLEQNGYHFLAEKLREKRLVMEEAARIGEGLGGIAKAGKGGPRL